jgi:hypothetical protein
VQEMIDALHVEKLRLLDLRLMLCKHSRSGAHKRLVAALDAVNLAISDINNEKGKKNESHL